jgi:hypothetical protein
MGWIRFIDPELQNLYDAKKRIANNEQGTLNYDRVTSTFAIHYSMFIILAL